ncbi:MAG: hypothetical protein KJ955_04635 [Nanoarchaeota archaeon]|nr:hypothetical protein [Nanoarchaeota archaeon]
MKKSSFLALSVFAVALALFFFGRVIYQTLGELRQIDLSMNYTYAFSSVLFCLAGFFLLAVGYHLTLTKIGAVVLFRKSFKARAFSELGSYVPGKLMTLFARMHYLRKWASKTEVVASSSIECAALIFSSILAFVLINLIQPGIFSEYSLEFSN